MTSNPAFQARSPARGPLQSKQDHQIDSSRLCLAQYVGLHKRLLQLMHGLWSNQALSAQTLWTPQTTSHSHVSLGFHIYGMSLLSPTRSDQIWSELVRSDQI